jgi:hypothetical protein
MGYEIHKKCFTYLLCNSLMREKELHVKEVARVLTIKGGTQLATVQVRDRKGLHLREQLKLILSSSAQW